MAQVTIDRELLERFIESATFGLGMDNPDITAAKSILATPRQPEGDGLEVVAWNITVKMDGRTWSEYTEKLPFLPDAKVTWHSEPEPVCRLSDAQRAIAGLVSERDTLRQQLADSDAALRESRANDTAAMGHLADMRHQRDRLAGLLREIAVGVSKREMPTEQQLNAWFDRIDAALAEVKPCPESPAPTT